MPVSTSTPTLTRGLWSGVSTCCTSTSSMSSRRRPVGHWHLDAALRIDKATGRSYSRWHRTDGGVGLTIADDPPRPVAARRTSVAQWQHHDARHRRVQHRRGRGRSSTTSRRTRVVGVELPTHFDRHPGSVRRLTDGSTVIGWQRAVALVRTGSCGRHARSHRRRSRRYWIYRSTPAHFDRGTLRNNAGARAGGALTIPDQPTSAPGRTWSRREAALRSGDRCDAATIAAPSSASTPSA